MQKVEIKKSKQRGVVAPEFKTDAGYTPVIVPFTESERRFQKRNSIKRGHLLVVRNDNLKRLGDEVQA